MNPVALRRPALQVGDTVSGKYRIDGVIGSGGMGVVYAAHHLMLGEAVALKLPLADQPQRLRTVARVLREARATTRIKSRHVVRVRDVDTLGNGVPFVVMDRLVGQDLSALLRERGPLPYRRAVSLILPICEALAEAHALGVIHRDIKPSNIFLERETGLVKLLDFGVALARFEHGASDELTRSGEMLGSPQYVAPEQIRDAGKVSGSADVWSLGVVLYELVSGRRPFARSSAAGELAAILEDPPQALAVEAVEGGQLPPEFFQAIQQCLEKQPQLRITGVVELARRLVPFAEDGALQLRDVLAAQERATAGTRPQAREDEPHDLDATIDPQPASARPAGIAPPLNRRGWLAAGAAGVVGLCLLGWARPSVSPAPSLENLVPPKLDQRHFATRAPTPTALERSAASPSTSALPISSATQRPTPNRPHRTPSTPPPQPDAPVPRTATVPSPPPPRPSARSDDWTTDTRL